METSIDCPKCGLKDSHTFYEGTENGAPHGAGYWPMQVSDASQQCDCELSDTEMAALAAHAWELVELKALTQDVMVHAQQLSGLKKAVLRIQAMKPEDRLLALAQLSHSCYEYDEQDWPY